MKILILGGAGFLGSNLIRFLLRKTNHKILCIDNLITGNLQNLSSIKSNRLIFEKKDIRKRMDYNCDFIFNLACPASPPHYQKNPILTLETCMFGLMNALKLSVKNNAPLFHSSTSEVYGDPTISPQKETYLGNVNSYGPRSCYDEGKRVAESIIYEYKKKFNIDVRIARIFNTYGPYMSAEDGRVVSNFINQAIKEENITIYGSGNQTRSFCYVDDLIEGIAKISFAKKTKHDIYNIGNPSEINLLKLSQIVKNISNSKSKIIHKEIPIDDPKQRRPSIDRIKKEFNWKPKVSLEKGLLKTLKYFKEK